MKTLDDILFEERVTLRSSVNGKHHTTCPQCSKTRKKANQKKPCLRVHIDERGVRFTCFHCGWFTARFFDEGETNGRHHSGTFSRSRDLAGRSEEHPARDSFGTRGSQQRTQSGVRVPQEWGPPVQKSADREAGREIVHARSAERTVVSMERRLSQRTVRSGRASNHHRRRI